MENVREILRTILYEIAVRTHRYRVALRIMAAMVVFVTTYLLILPAATLDHDEASRQGGISVPVLSSVISEEDSASTDNITSGDDSTTIDADSGQSSNDIPAEGSGSSQNTDGSIEADNDHNGADSETSSADSVNEPDESADLLNDAATETDKQSSVDNDGSANLIYDGKGYTVRVDDDNAVLPEDTQLRVSEITEDSDPDEYEKLLDKSKKAVSDEAGDNKAPDITFARFYDITLESDGREITPDDAVKVTISYDRRIRKDLEAKSKEDIRVIHFASDNKTGAPKPEILNEDVELTLSRNELSEASFKADSFSVYAVLGTTLERRILASDGHNYHISVTYGADSGIPADADLSVEEISESSDGYDEYVSGTKKALGVSDEAEGYIRLFDISIVDRNDPDVKYQPLDGSSVAVRIELEDLSGDEISVVHFADGSNGGDVVEHTTENSEGHSAIEFNTDGFSVYSITTDFTVPTYEDKVTSIEENVGYYLSNQSRFITNSEYTAANPNGLGKTQIRKQADLFYFEKSEEDGKYFIYTYTEEGGPKQYMYFDYLDSQNGHIKLSEEKPEVPLTVTAYNASQGLFLISGTADNGSGSTATWYINQFGGTNGARFAGWHVGSTDGGSRILITKPSDLPADALGLDGKTCALLNFKSDISGYVMMDDAISNKTRLERKWTLIKEEPLEHSGRVFIAEDADAAMWTFHSVDKDIYYLTTEIDGETKFMKVAASGLSLVDVYDPSCNITIEPGTGNRSGKLKFIGPDGSVIRMHENSNTNGFGTTTAADNDNDWMNLAVKFDLNDEDFVSYSARKVSVSDTVNVSDGKQIVVYTRAWNDTTKEYEFYAVNHDGSLVRVYENGTEIKWAGTQINTLLWDFTEYKNEDGTPNYYYELQNDYSGKYLVPQILGNNVLSDDPIGLNLNGRRYGEYSTTILAWDDPDYQYSGYKVENGHLVACPLSQAEDFYFAVMEPEEFVELTTVNTVDNDDFGISMKMIDYNGEKTNNGTFDKTQTDVMGATGNDKNLVNPYLESDGYPLSTKTGKSLSELFGEATDVNHLFLADTYNESGYFEYNCTENFAHLVQEGDTKWIEEGYQIGDFVVYDQVGTIESSNISLKHGQFMPYNDLDGTISTRWTNQTDETDAVLPYTDPRKDKMLYTIPYNASKPALEDNNADFHFGMEMTASFTQTANGLDAWGHDIIFEFAGDDDMFFFVDDVLILDLGGVHAAQTGKINFRTGDMTSSRGNSNLLTLFTNSYKAQHPDWTQASLNEWLEGIFKKDDRGRLTSVFQDYSTHTMRMIYMERGAGASNLHMRFNLAAVKPGTVQLGKSLSGIDENDNINAEYPYQIWYTSKNDPDPAGQTWHLLDERDRVKYLGSTRNVKYAQSYSVTGVDEPYEHVFFLKPGEVAEITMPGDTLEYKIVECGVNPKIYDVVKANDDEITGVPNGDKKDYPTSSSTVNDRQTVNYDNHVKDGAMRTLSFTKELYDVAGNRIPHSQNDTVFNFRLYLGGENDTDLTLANMQAYHVKDENGRYCRWDNSTRKFVPLPGNKTDYDSLTDAEKEAATFHSSINGAITYIPVDYTVEVRQLLTDSKFRITERENEVPEGYSWKAYTLDGEPTGTTQSEGVSGIIPENAEDPDPNAAIQNYKGWGITVKKVWTDADFMDSHDTVYFAVYTRGSGGQLTLVNHTVRPMTPSAASQYWYFDRLENGASFENHVIREVTITNDDPHLDADGCVIDPGTVTPVDEGGSVEIKATPTVDHTEALFDYTVHYQQGTVDENDDNIRTDIVTNTRPGIRIVKEDFSGSGLADAVFTLKGSSGSDVGRETYKSGQDGLVTIAYLPEGTFTLDEISSPSGYAGLSGALTITNNDGSVEVTGSEADKGMYSFTPATGTSEAVITVRNKPFTLKAVKTDASSYPLAGVHFALYRQVKSSSGQMIRDYYPIEGYEDLVSGTDGIIPKVSQTLPAGTYYLHETQALDQYKPIEKDICFTISNRGIVTIADEEMADRSLTSETAGNTIRYTMTIRNAEAWQKIRITKVDITNPSVYLKGAVFNMYRVIDGHREDEPMYADLTSNEQGVLEYRDGASDPITIFELPVGVYHLVEKSAPDGYLVKENAVVITVTSTNVTYDEGTTLSQSGSGRSYDASESLYTLKVSDTAGHELPKTGGAGTSLIYLLGIILICAGGAGMVMIRRRRSEM